MSRKHSISAFFLLVLAQFAFGQVSQDRLHYINKYSKIAQEEMERSGVPASIKLAQAILESNGGKSTLSRKANNHFGIKCGGDWKDGGYSMFDDEVDKRGNKVKSCFRMYKNPESSFIAHSEFLRNNQRYEALFALDAKDYHGWAHGLKKAGYATNPKYPKLLITIIENYGLDVFDDLFAPAPGTDALVSNTEEEPEKTKQNEVINNAVKISKLNDISVVYAATDDTPEIISVKTSVSLRRILKYNETLTEPGQVIPENTMVFLQPKRRAFRGRKKFHKVADGENLIQVSQKYGIRLDHLLKRNRLAANQEPLEGAILKIRGNRVDSNWEIATREVYVAGMPSTKEEKKAKDKFATSISDFEAPPTLGEEKEETGTIKTLGFGKKKKNKPTTRSTETADIATSTTQNDWTEEKEEKVGLATRVKRAPLESTNYQTNGTSANATFKKEMVSSNPTISKVKVKAPTTTINNYPNTNSTTGAETKTVYAPTQSTTPAGSNTNAGITSSKITTPSAPTMSTPTASTYSNSTPVSTPIITTPASTTPAAASVKTQYHTVIKGETLYRLSKQYGTSVDYIKQVNGLNSNTISIGQKLIVN